MPSAPPRLVRIFFGRSPKRALYRAAAFGLLTGVICIYVVRPCRVKGRSMEPTFMDGRFNAITLLSYRNEAPQRGDIVAARMSSLDTRNFYLKRILGLPGERIAFEQGTLIIDGAPVPSPMLFTRAFGPPLPCNSETTNFTSLATTGPWPMSCTSEAPFTANTLSEDSYFNESISPHPHHRSRPRRPLVPGLASSRRRRKRTPGYRTPAP